MRVSNKSFERYETLLIVLLVTFGITLASLVSGAQSGVYFLVTISAGLLSLVKLARSPRRNVIVPAFAGAMVLLFVWVLQVLSFQSGQYGFNLMGSLFNSLAIQVIIIVAAALSTAPEKSLVNAFFIACVAHLITLVYGISAGGLAIAQIGEVRFSGAGFREVIWAEVALGTLALAILSGRTYVVVLSVPVAGILIAATQMRTIGIAAFVGVLVFLYYQLYFKQRKTNKQILLLLIPILLFWYVVLQRDAIVQAVSAILLLDDMHRGLSSGFSGRFDNILLGWELFQGSPIIGVGSLQEDAAYVHNGYVKVLAQYGVFGVFWIALIGVAIWKAWAQRNYPLLTVIFMLVLFYVGQPRHLSLQVFPLVGVLAVFQAIAIETPSRMLKNPSPGSV